MSKKALITGITGQDGSYLAEFLLEKGYEVSSKRHRFNVESSALTLSQPVSLLSTLQVHGIVRRSSSFNTGRINHIYKDRHETGVKLYLHYGKNRPILQSILNCESSFVFDVGI